MKAAQILSCRNYIKGACRKDDLGDGALVDMILDKAGQKGTGRWSSEAALAFGIRP